MKKKLDNSEIRAVGYSRTSGESQRHNTSIPNQKKSIERFINRQEGWRFVRHYVDESKSGAKIEGRDDFQRMIRDAEKGEFDIIVIHSLSRFGRDAVDILYMAKELKRKYKIFTIDTDGDFDNRSYTKNFTNIVKSGLVDQDRLDIMRRCYEGRKARAAAGEKWCNLVPFGRMWDADNKKFIISEDGEKLQKLLPRYVGGESLKDLAIEFGFKSEQTITRAIRESQLSGTYYATFNEPDIDVIDEKVAVPGMPEIIRPALFKRVKDKLAHNRRWNKSSKHLLRGFVRCAHCGEALKPQLQPSGHPPYKNHILYYRHYYKNYYADDRDKQTKCPAYRSIRADQLEGPALDYLFSWFVDKPAFQKAVRNALPDIEDRKAAEQDIKSAKKQLAKLERDEQKLVNALLNGRLKKTDVVVAEQDKIIEKRAALQKRSDDLQQTLDNMQDPEETETEAELIRLTLVSQQLGKDWRKMPYAQVRRFLHFLFSDNPNKYGYGIFVGKEKGQWIISFEGSVPFYHDIKNKQPEFINDLTAAQKDLINIQNEFRHELKKGFEQAMNNRIQADKDYERQVRETEKKMRRERRMSNIKPNSPNS